MNEFKAMLNNILTQMGEKDATDLHIVSNEYVYFRIDGDIIPTNLKLSSDQIYSLCLNALDPLQQNEYLQKDSIDFGYSVNGLRFRGNMCKIGGNHSCVFRKLNERIFTMDELQLPEILKSVLDTRAGLILVTGATGSGKSTSLAAMINEINETKKFHITTAENPVEYIHPSKQSLVTQREVGKDTPTFFDCLHDALRRDPDVIVVGEMRDPQTVSTAIGGAGTGHLVLGTLHTNNAPDTINRILDLYEGAARDLVRSQLSSYLLAVVSQQLVKKKDGGRVAVFELLIPNKEMRQIIREGRTELLYDCMEKAKDEGNIIMSDMFEEYQKRGIIA
ncbi:PilT/PilU family type 4a pilus ATPase [Bacillus bombysepticus]|uniref:type IV pilus twitching motility protein PilT n=1 Tax=Bacillus bombysepticus TaxID=658666 RepID=UPI003019D9C4